MTDAESTKAHIVGGIRHTEQSREWATKLGGSFNELNSELGAALSGLEKVLGHLGKAEEIYRDKLKPQNLGVVLGLEDALSEFVTAGGLESNVEGVPAMLGDNVDQREAFSEAGATLQDSYTELFDVVAKLQEARDKIKDELFTQTNPDVSESAAQTAKGFAENIAPGMESLAQTWHDSI